MPRRGDRNPRMRRRHDVGDEARRELVPDPGLLLALVGEVVAEQAFALGVAAEDQQHEVMTSSTMP